MYESLIWQDIEHIAAATGKHPDDVYAELMVDFQKLVARRLKKVQNDSKVARLRNSCPTCSAISVVRSKRSEWHCERCALHFQTPAKREYAYASNQLPPLLQNIIENKEKVNDCKNR